MAPPPQESLPPDDGGSAAEPILYGGDSTEEPISEPPPNDPSVEDSGSSSELGGPPSISSIEAQFNSGQWVSIVGTVTDPGGSVEGMTVYFMVGYVNTVSFTTTVAADGSFRSLDLGLDAGTLIRAYTIDSDGNYSEIASCAV